MTAPAKRDIVFLLADKGMELVVTGFLTRERCHLSLRCAAFGFDPRKDIIVSPTKDSGMLKYARGLLKSYEATHKRAVLIVDDAYQGNPGTELLRERLTEALSQGWKEFAVIIIKPELEAWLMNENAHLPRIFRCPPNYRQLLADAGLWPSDVAKPPDPKTALKHLKDHHGARAGNAEFGKLAAATSVRYCQDPAFIQLRDQLRTWFPEQS